MNLIEGWHQQFSSRDHCPWQGPRPMRSADDAREPFDRVYEAEDFAQKVFDTDVVIFTGASGVGKTSMLNVQLLPALESDGYQVLVCDEWARSTVTSDAGELIATILEPQLPPGVWLGPDRPALVEQLDTMYPGKAVIILDQFEELMRYQPELAQSVFRWIKDTADNTHVRLVISLRIEYEHELRGRTGLKLGSFQQTRYELNPLVDPEAMRSIIEAGNRIAPSIEASAADEILLGWAASGAVEGTSEIGLLHLQATLYTLWMRRSGEGPITLDDVLALESEAQRTDMPLFEHALAASVAVALEHCRDACEPTPGWQGLEPSLRVRAAQLVASVSTHLSSGGFKVSHDREQLARRVVLGEIDDGVIADRYGPGASDAVSRLSEQVDSAAKALRARQTPIDWLSTTRSALLGEQGIPGLAPWEVDPTEITAGFVQGLRPVDSLLESYRSYYLALEWLRACELVRLTSPEPGKTMVGLIHDRFATGLEHWRSSVRAGVTEAAASVSAIKGAWLDWSLQAAAEEKGFELLVNLRWQSCTIQGRTFRGVAFVNCDFRGTRFLGCTFQGATFVNCLLDDVEFRDCVIVGAPSELPADLTLLQKETPPAFFIPVDQQTFDALNTYRETDVATSSTQGPRILSERPGLAAVASNADSHVREVPFMPELGGLCMYGGHLSSLKVRGCTFGGDGVLSLRYVAGSSVELSEQRDARVQIFAAAVRGLTVTRPIDALGEAAQSDSAAFTFSVSDSKMINVWFGPGMSGEATFTNCVVVQLMNGSESLAVALPESPELGAVNVVVNDDLVEKVRWNGDDLTLARDWISEQVFDSSWKIDYRRFPARYDPLKRPERA